MTPEQKAKLPGYARDYIQTIERQREDAVRVLNEAVDRQTPQPFYIRNHVMSGERNGPVDKKFYIDAPYGVEVEHLGVYLRVWINEDGIALSWNTNDRSSMGDVAFVPTSYQNATLKSHANMRVR